MVERYDTSVIELVKSTPNTPKGIRKVTDTAEESIAKIDEDIADLLAQRSKLVSIVERNVELFPILEGEELRDSMHVHILKQPPHQAELAENLRKEILNIADSCESRTTDEFIVMRLKQEYGSLPWKNPKAVIGTVLYRSGKWSKEKPGMFVKIKGIEE